MEEKITSLNAQLQVKSDAVDGLEKQRADDGIRLANVHTEKQKLEVRNEVLSVFSVRDLTVFISGIGEEDGGGDHLVEGRSQGQV